MWYLVMSRTLREISPAEPAFKQHAAWLDDGHRNGQILFSGPTSDRTFGVYVILAPDIEAARTIAGQDPYHQDGSRELNVYEWDIRRALRLDGSIADFEARVRSS